MPLVFAESLHESVTWALVHFLWQGMAIAAGLALLLRCGLLKSVQSRYVASVGALGIMALGVVATCWYEQATQVDVPSTLFAQATNDTLALNDSPVPSANVAVVTSPAVVDSAVVNVPRNLLPGQFDTAIARLQPYLLWGWVAGVFICGLRLITGYVGTLWLRAGRQAVSAAVYCRATELSRRLGLGRFASVYGSTRVTQAIAVGYLKPMVLVPMAWLNELPPEALDAIIAHELAHIRRWDHWVVLMQRMLETLLFYHPAVWWVSRQVSLEREMCCDELAVAATGRRLDYAKTLETVGRWSTQQGTFLFATSFQGESQMELLKRVRNVLGLSPQREAGLAWPAAVLALILSANLAAPAIDSFAQEGGPKPEARRDGDRPAEGVRREGERPVEGRREGDRPAEGVRREGDRPVEGRREGERPAEGYRREGEQRSPSTSQLEAALREFRPQTPREAALFQVIMQMRNEMMALRRQVEEIQRFRGEGTSPFESPREGVREGDRPREGAREGAREGDRPREGARDGDRPREGARDGDRPREGAREGARDGEGFKPGPRDGEGVKAGPRDGEGAPKRGPRDGEGEKPGPREG